jgi:hypothetical protein
MYRNLIAFSTHLIILKHNGHLPDMTGVYEYNFVL